MKAAYFIPDAGQAGKPQNDAITGALEAAGFDIDIYASTGEIGGTIGARTRLAGRVHYGWRWLARNALAPRWRAYSVFSASAEDPIAIGGTLAFAWRRPFIAMADEIMSGSYAGNRSASWKRYCRWAMRRAKLTVVNDASRVPLQREYAELVPSRRVVVYPEAFRCSPPPGARAALRRRYGIPDEAFTLVSTGTFAPHCGSDWLLAALRRIADLHILLQPGRLDPLVRTLLSDSRYSERLHIEPRWVDSYSEICSSLVAGDMGMVVYLHDGPQWQNMGTASTKLNMLLSMGIPVVASRQPSFEFLEQYGCGVLVRDEEEFIEGIQSIRRRREEMSPRAALCFREYVNPAGSWERLAAAVRQAVQ